MSSNPPIVLVSFTLDYPPGFLGIVFVAFVNMMLQAVYQEVLAQFFGDRLELAQFLDTYLELGQDEFKGPHGQVRKLQSSAHAGKAFLLDLVVTARRPSDDLVLDPMKDIPWIYPTLYCRRESK